MSWADAKFKPSRNRGQTCLLPPPGQPAFRRAARAAEGGRLLARAAHWLCTHQRHPVRTTALPRRPLPSLHLCRSPRPSSSFLCSRSTLAYSRRSTMSGARFSGLSLAYMHGSSLRSPRA